jgi:hypothetical protein
MAGGFALFAFDDHHLRLHPLPSTPLSHGGDKK